MSADNVSSDQIRITISSMSVAGDSLYLVLDRGGSMHIGLENDDGSNDAYFDREQQIRLRDWLNKVLP